MPRSSLCKFDDGRRTLRGMEERDRGKLEDIRDKGIVVDH